ncbi:unnamed protein product, partial [Symbiodinium pilosum]
MCDAWRRLVLPYENITYSVLSLADMDAEQGLELFWREFHKVSGCDLCEDHFFAKVFYDYLFAPNIDQQTRLQRYQSVRLCIKDTVMQGPASSVEIEKNHANLQ